MNILFISAEVGPYVSIGGLSQVMFFLPQALRRLGHDVRIFTAKYGAMDENAPKGDWQLKTEMNKIAVPVENDPVLGKSILCNVKSYQNEHNKIITYFLENREYYELRANVFGYKDDHIRFSLLSKGALEWLYQKKQQEKDEWFPDIVHCHDWHTGYFVDLARRDIRYKEILKKTSTVFTVHNFAFQGNYDFKYSPKDEYDDGKMPLGSLTSHTLQTQNALKRAIMYADAVNTVSATHAVEVLTPEYAEGLEDVLNDTRDKLTGILNGLDTQSFNPATDKTIKKQFSVHSFIKAREENKKELQKIFGLSIDPQRPLLAVSGRLSKQKGWDLLLRVLPNLLVQRPEVQVIVMGSGDDRYRLELTVLQKKFPQQIGLHLRPDFRLPRKIYAGADMTLIPSIFEPGGIVALEALRYGCVPIVRRTGGLNDIVTDFSPKVKIGNGFSFREKDPWALFATIIEALTIYKYPKLWKTVVTNCLSSDFSWEHAAVEYDSWYRRVTRGK
jgi:starch synthase